MGCRDENDAPKLSLNLCKSHSSLIINNVQHKFSLEKLKWYYNLNSEGENNTAGAAI